jgi:hypothetical protein
MIKEEFLNDVSNYNNHLVLMWLALGATATAAERSVLELGMGYGSTPMLRQYCENNGRYLKSCDNNPEWVERFKSFQCVGHGVKCYAPDWSDADFFDKKWGVVLIDHAPGEQRVTDLLRLKLSALAIVVHDTEPHLATQYSAVWPLFFFKASVAGHSNGAWATIVSDNINVSLWKGMKLGGYEVI